MQPIHFILIVIYWVSIFGTCHFTFETWNKSFAPHREGQFDVLARMKGLGQEKPDRLSLTYSLGNEDEVEWVIIDASGISSWSSRTGEVTDALTHRSTLSRDCLAFSKNRVKVFHSPPSHCFLRRVKRMQFNNESIARVYFTHRSKKQEAWRHVKVRQREMAGARWFEQPLLTMEAMRGINRNKHPLNRWRQLIHSFFSLSLSLSSLNLVLIIGPTWDDFEYKKAPVSQEKASVWLKQSNNSPNKTQNEQIHRYLCYLRCLRHSFSPDLILWCLLFTNRCRPLCSCSSRLHRSLDHWSFGRRSTHHRLDFTLRRCSPRLRLEEINFSPPTNIWQRYE